MTMKDECQRHLALVREAASSPEAAYLARTRLKRLILTCSRAVAREHGVPEPSMPGPFQAPPGASETEHLIAVLCSRLSESAEILCQPSEPLNTRWRSGWAEAQADLDALDRALAA